MDEPIYRVIPTNPEDAELADTMTAMFNHVLSELTTEEFIEKVLEIDLKPYQKSIIQRIARDGR